MRARQSAIGGAIGGAFILIEILLIIPAFVGASIIDWMLIVVPNLIDTVLFIFTNGLIASIAAHAFHNAIIVLIILFQYVN